MEGSLFEVPNTVPADKLVVLRPDLKQGNAVSADLKQSRVDFRLKLLRRRNDLESRDVVIAPRLPCDFKGSDWSLLLVAKGDYFGEQVMPVLKESFIEN